MIKVFSGASTILKSATYEVELEVQKWWNSLQPQEKALWKLHDVQVRLDDRQWGYIVTYKDKSV